MSNKSLKLAVRVEIWHNFSPIIRENIEDKINKGVHHLWGGLGGGKGEDEFPWKLYIHSEETEEDGNFTVEVHFKHRKIRDSDPDLLKGSEIQKLCKKMLDSDPQSFARKIGIDGGALNWKPVSGGDNLSWQDRHFGMTYCIQLLERLEIQEGVPNILSHGPLQSMVLMSDTLAWFTSHIEQLQAMLPAGNTADNSTRAPFVLLRCLKASIVLQSSMCQWSDMPVQSQAKDSKSTLGSEVQSSTELFMAASTGAMQIIGELTANASYSDPSKIELCSTRDLGEANEAMAVVMQRAFPAYKASKKLANTKKSEGYLWGIGTGVCALAAVGVCLYDSPLSLIAMHVFESVGARCAVKTGITWEKQKKWKKSSKAIFDIGTASHEIWLFMMLYHMRLNGLVTQDTVAFLQFAKNIAETFDGVDVIENWGDINYVQSWVKGQAEYIQERLADVHARDD